MHQNSAEIEWGGKRPVECVSHTTNDVAEDAPQYYSLGTAVVASLPTAAPKLPKGIWFGGSHYTWLTCTIVLEVERQLF